MVQEIDIMIIDDSRCQVIDREFVIQISSNREVLDTATITILENDGELMLVHIGKSIDCIKQLSHFFTYPCASISFICTCRFGG